MVPGRARIESLEAGRAVLAGGSDGTAVLVVPVAGAVPAWLADLVREVHHAVMEVVVVVEAEPPADLEDEALDGWEIGVCTAAVAAGVDQIVGIDPQRVARVREVDASLAAHAAEPATEVAS